jgi:hypothetical protein
MMTHSYHYFKGTDNDFVIFIDDIYLWPYNPFAGPWPLFQFLNTYTQSVGLLGRGMSASQGLYLNTEQHKHNKRTHTSMP